MSEFDHEQSEKRVMASLHELHRKAGIIMAGIDDLRGAIADLETAVTSESAELSSLHDELVKAETQITSLQASLAAGNVVSDADLEALASTVGNIAAAATAATTAATAVAPEDESAAEEAGEAPGDEAAEEAVPGGGASAPAPGGTV